MVNGSNEKSKIDYCISKLRSSLNDEKRYDNQEINQILDTLNTVNWIAVAIDEKFVCIRVCCSLNLPADSALIGKCSQVITKIIESVELKEELGITILRWCLHFLTQSPDISQIEVLVVLECLFKKNIEYSRAILDEVLRILKEPLENKTRILNPGEILLQRLKCIRVLTPILQNYHFKIVKDIFVELNQQKLTIEKSVKLQIILEQLETLTYISEKNITWLSDNLGIVLGISLSVASCGLPHHIDSVPQYLLPTSVLFPDNKPNVSRTNNKNKNRRKQKKNPSDKIKTTPLDDIVTADFNWSQTSDSDFSDSETSRLACLRKMERRIRLSALSLLLHVVKTINKKDLVGYWDNILSGPYSILKTLLNDNSPRTRMAILSILSILFSTGKTYLLQAQHAPKGAKLPYVSWSDLLADLISTTHSVLCEVVLQGQSVGSTLSTLQCLIVFLRNTPYHRLNDGLLKNVVQSINPLLKHIDCTVRLAAIKCLNEVVIFEPNTEEQILLMRLNHIADSREKNSDSWIVSYCLESIENEKVAIIVRAECWFLLGNLIKHHFINIGCGAQLPRVLSLLQRDLQDSNIVIQQKAAKAFEQIAVPLGSLDTTCGIDCYKVWFSMLQGPLVPMLQSTSGILASAAADCIANITASVFEQLSERMRIFVMTALCGCVSHEEHIARSAAVRTLGTIVVFPFLSENIQIIYDVADRIVCAMKDENLSVRMKAAWALGNLSDVLLNGRKIGIPIEEVSLLNLLEQAVQTKNDHEKVKACSMRAIGNLFLLVEEHHIKIERFQSLVIEAASALVHNAANENNMKVRWNACYSLGNMFKNTLLSKYVHDDWQDCAFEILSKLIVSCSNFKVRQAASNALTTVTSKVFYGKHYSLLWPCLMKAFVNSQNLTEFSEYKHQRNLIDQLCLSLCHLTMFLEQDDLVGIGEVISSNMDSCKQYVVEFKRRNGAMKEKFDESVSYLKKLLESNLNEKQRDTLLLLVDVIKAEDVSDETQVLRC